MLTVRRSEEGCSATQQLDFLRSRQTEWKISFFVSVIGRCSCENCLFAISKWRFVLGVARLQLVKNLRFVKKLKPLGQRDTTEILQNMCSLLARFVLLILPRFFQNLVYWKSWAGTAQRLQTLFCPAISRNIRSSQKHCFLLGCQEVPSSPSFCQKASGLC